MNVDYANVVQTAIALQDVGTDAERRATLDAAYEDAVAVVVEAILTQHPKAKPAAESVGRDFDEIAAMTDPGLALVYDRVRYDIIRRIDAVAGPSPARQAAITRLIGVAGVAAVLLICAGYAAVRSYSATPVTAAIETRLGMQQRADALAKMFRHASFGTDSGRRGLGFIKAIVLWPIEPTEAELRGAGELAGLILAGAREMGAARMACNLPVQTGRELSDAEIALIERVLDHLRNETTIWRDPPAMTVIDPIRATYPC